MNNQECSSAKQVALSRLNALSEKYLEQTSCPSNADFFASDEATVRTLREFMSLTASAMTELSDQIQSNELAAEKRHEEILAASKSSDRLNWPTLYHLVRNGVIFFKTISTFFSSPSFIQLEDHGVFHIKNTTYLHGVAKMCRVLL